MTVVSESRTRQPRQGSAVPVVIVCVIAALLCAIVMVLWPSTAPQAGEIRGELNAFSDTSLCITPQNEEETCFIRLTDIEMPLLGTYVSVHLEPQGLEDTLTAVRVTDISML